MKHPWLIIVGTVVVLLAGWMIHDLTSTERHSLRQFDAHEVARLETDMWRSYYEYRRFHLPFESVDLLRRQYHLPFWASCVAAYHAARAATVFQAGQNRRDYEQAVPDLVSYYALVRQHSDEPFEVNAAARQELEWWIIHRERASHSFDDLAHSLALLQAGIYHQPDTAFAEHAAARANAMLLRDQRQESGRVTEDDWSRIQMMLDDSWTSLHDSVAR
jgi:hypothetical protein